MSTRKERKSTSVFLMYCLSLSGDNFRAKLSGSSPSGNGMQRTFAPSGRRFSILLMVAACPALSPSKTSVIFRVKRISCLRWFVVMAVPEPPTVFSIPDFTHERTSNCPSVQKTLSSLMMAFLAWYKPKMILPFLNRSVSRLFRYLGSLSFGWR